MLAKTMSSSKLSVMKWAQYLAVEVGVGERDESCSSLHSDGPSRLAAATVDPNPSLTTRQLKEPRVPALRSYPRAAVILSFMCAG
jgi:hypothetical protein